MASNPYVGQRLSFEGALCTVRYVGPVSGTEKAWLGVEWDDPSRGKHDGEHKGVRYFSCRSKSKLAASFIRPSRATDPVQSFVEAVHQKYASELIERREAVAPVKEIEVGGKIAYEVGFDKIREQLAQLHELKIVLVDGLRIVKAETSKRVIREVCPRIVELDLSRNLFESCKEIIKICGELDKLKLLKLNGNRLEIREADFEIPNNPQSSLAGIKELGLDEMLMPWEDICMFAEQFLDLCTLSAASNDLAFLPKIASRTMPPGLKSLTLDYNTFSSLTDFQALTALTSLEMLHLKGNQIQNITGSENAMKPIFGKNLRYVDLSYNNVTTWTFVDSLSDVFPGLTGLRFSHNPIYEAIVKAGETASSVDEGYMLTLARLANLKTLNYSNITPAERTNAEMYYLSRIGKEMAAVGEAEEHHITSQHKRYKELCYLYGEPIVVRTDTTIHPEWVEARLINFTFYIPAGTLPNQVSEIIKTKEIPKGFDIYRVKGIVGRLFGLKPLTMRLIWDTGEWDPVAGFEDDEGDNSDDDEDSREQPDAAAKAMKAKGKWMRREVELEDSTRQVGFCIDGMAAKVRIELR